MRDVRDGPAAAVASLAAGVETLGALLARTYGPVAAPVLLDSGRALPEFVEDAGVLARRITGLSDRRRHAGVMALRESCLATRRRNGDGAATLAVLARSMVARATRLVVAGADPVAVRRGIDRGVAAACAALTAAAVPVGGAGDLRRLAAGASHDVELADVLGELFDLLGERAALIVEERDTPGVDRGYVDGARWRAKPAFREVLPDGSTDVALQDPVIVVADATLTAAADVVPALEHALASRRPLLLVVRGIEGGAKAAVLANRARLAIVPMRLASIERQVPDDVADLALLTGATLLGDAVGHPPRALRPEHCGAARHVVLTRRHVTVSGGAGTAADTAERAGHLLGRAVSMERGSDEWRATRMRIARLTGAQGVIVVGGYTETERQLRADLAGKAQRVLELAASGGAVPGGGVALHECADAVRAARSGCGDADETWGVDLVAAALSAPLRQLIENYRSRHDGPHPAVALERIAELGGGWGFDARQGDYAPMAKAGVLDAAGVLIGALQAAGSLAATVVGSAVVVPARKRAVA
ncbi:TCP-1/cpn60 chaperonin family protein [Jiangella endophytica]|uniref:TCP-1/cpn60 chaperonin family protein n=1 Tax=Jiangella endophytica TaxID=1623398 RepID=UPI000E34A654|nr:TCP-1/cpn60 chaperonin family protein [Jiangella endophytica]